MPSTTITITIRVELEEVPGKGWIARAPVLRATAQGDSEDEAMANLDALLHRYPEVFEPLLEEAKSTGTQLELVPA